MCGNNPVYHPPQRPAECARSNQTVDAYSLKSLSSLKLHYYDLVLKGKPNKPQRNPLEPNVLR